MRRLALELATFAALAWYAAAHWASGLVEDASGWKVFACVVAAMHSDVTGAAYECVKYT